MDNPQKKSGAQQAPPPAPASRSTEPENVGKRFEQAYQDYLNALKENQVDAHKRCLQTQRDYTSALQNSWVETQKRLHEVNQTYVTQVQDAWGDENAQKLVSDAYRTYTRALREACEDAQKRWQDANDEFTKPVQDLGEETKRRHERAFQDYLNAIKDAWAALDAKTLDANTFAALSNNIAAAGWFALNTAGQSSST